MTLNAQSANDNAREHGGNLAFAAAYYGVSDMIDLSTGISPVSYPALAITADMLQTLPQQGMLDACLLAARRYYKVPDNLDIVAGPGTQALLQMVPLCIATRSGAVETVWIRQPTYNEHHPAWHSAGFQAIGGNDLPDEARHAVMVVPNNPTGAVNTDQICDVAKEISHRNGLMMIDGAFADGALGEDLLAQHGKNEAVIHLRSFGKFFGLAGLRLGFAIGTPDLIEQLRSRAGPWAVNNAALIIGAAALNDAKWCDAHRKWLQEQSDRLANLLIALGFSLQGGTALFQTIAHRDAHKIHHHLARTGIWTRAYDDYPELLRLGLPGNEPAWKKLEAALSSLRQ